jgi:hypothetical protein
MVDVVVVCLHNIAHLIVGVKKPKTFFGSLEFPSIYVIVEQFAFN